MKIVMLCIMLLMSMSACGGSVPQNVTPAASAVVNAVPTSAESADGRPTLPPLPTAPVWRAPTEPITAQNIERLALLGQLGISSGEPSTIFDYAISADSTRLAVLNNSFLMVWDLVTGEEVFSMTRQDESRVFYSPDKNSLYTVGASGILYLVNAETGAIQEQLMPSEDAPYNGLTTYHPETGTLVVGGANGDIKVWAMLERTLLATITLSDRGEVTAAPNTPPAQAISLAFSPDGERLAAAYDDGSVWLWDWRNRAPAVMLAALPPEQQSMIDKVQVSPDGQYIVGMTSSYGIVWDAQTGALRHLLEVGAGGSAFLFKFAPPDTLPGIYALTGGTTRDTTLWDIQSGELASALPGVGGNNIDAAFSPDETLLLTTLFSGGITLWNLDNLASGTIARSTKVFENRSILNIAWTGDSFLILMFDARGFVEVWGIP